MSHFHKNSQKWWVLWCFHWKYAPCKYSWLSSIRLFKVWYYLLPLQSGPHYEKIVIPWLSYTLKSHIEEHQYYPTLSSNCNPQNGSFSEFNTGMLYNNNPTSYTAHMKIREDAVILKSSILYSRGKYQSSEVIPKLAHFPCRKWALLTKFRWPE